MVESIHAVGLRGRASGQPSLGFSEFGIGKDTTCK